MKRCLASLVSGILIAVAPLLHAAKAPLSQEELEKASSHIFSGAVLSVKTKDRKSQVETAVGIHRDRIYTITLEVKMVSKGSGVEAGDEIVIEAWRPIRRIPPLPGLQGHDSIPGKGDTVTVYATRKGDNQPFKPLLPNGFSTS